MKRGICVFLAGVMLAGMILSFTACRAQKAFYGLQEAYESKMLSYEDLQSIKYYSLNAYPEPLTAEEDTAIRQSFVDNFDAIKKDFKDTENLSLKGLEYSSPDELEIANYYGKYNGCYVICIELYFSALAAVWSFEIEDLTFYFGAGYYIFVWTNPEAIEFSLQATT